MVDQIRIWRSGALALALCFASTARAQEPAAGSPTPQTYFEFGTVISLGDGTISVQARDEQRGRATVHNFLLSRETHADAVRVGDTVEVIYSESEGGWTLRRLVLLSAGIPAPGRPSGEPRSTSAHRAAQSHGTAPSSQSAAAPSTPPSAVPAVQATSGLRGSERQARGKGSSARSSNSATRAASGAPVPSASAAAGRGDVPVDLGNKAVARTPTVIPVPLGAAEAIAKVTPPKTKNIARDAPSEECNRSSEQWPAEPITIAVLDFRYPTEREEAHDIGTTGGGSGTAVADLAFARLEALPDFLFRRGDRRRLDRSDFAGAARIGRQLGVDAVLAGTFVPVEPPAGSVTSDDFSPPPPRSYELRAGVVDTCTGQLLLRLDSQTCPAGVLPSTTAGAADACTHHPVTAAQATDPKAQARAFKPALDALLAPIEHSGTIPQNETYLGVVTEAVADSIAVGLKGGTRVAAGDQLSVHAWRLAKEPTTYTLHLLQGEETGRLTVTNVRGATVSGTYAGQYPAKAGDAVEVVAPQ